MNEFQAAMGLCNLRHIDSEIARRKRVAERYREHLEGIAGVKLCRIKDDVKYNYAYFPVIFDSDRLPLDRDIIFEKLKEQHIFTRKYFFPLINEFDCYRPIYHAAKTPVAKKIASSVLCLPIFADLEWNEVDEICRLIKDMIGK